MLPLRVTTEKKGRKIGRVPRAWKNVQANPGDTLASWKREHRKVSISLFHIISVILLMDKLLHQLIGSFSHYLQGFLHPRWCRILSINSISGMCLFSLLGHDLFEHYFAQGWNKNWLPPDFRKMTEKSGNLNHWTRSMLLSSQTSLQIIASQDVFSGKNWLV